VVRTEGLAEEDSLAENVQRAALHPLDQFHAFQTLREKGLSEEDIAARFFVSPTVVKQRLKLAAVSQKLLDVYAEDGMTLDQLMAFTVTNDHARQEQVWEALTHTYNKEPYHIRRQLTEGAVRAANKGGNSSASRPMKRRAVSSCAICSSMTMAAGSRTRRCSTIWLWKS
jgi:ParB family chromosome partitioning protein